MSAIHHHNRYSLKGVWQNFYLMAVNLVIDLGMRTVALFCATDNLIKGGAGQAIQSMNLMLGLDERLTLEDPGGYP